MFLTNVEWHDVQIIPLAHVAQFGIAVHGTHISESEAFLKIKILAEEFV